MLAQAEMISAAYDAVQAAYQTYLAQRLNLQGHIATYLGSWSGTGSIFYDSNFGDNALENLVQASGNLTPYLGGLSPSRDYSVEFLRVLHAGGE